MTKEDWKKIEDWWGDVYAPHLELRIDGFNVSLYNQVDKKKMIICVAVFVDDLIKVEYTSKDSTIGNRFYQRIRKPLYSAKALKDRRKTFGKRSEYAKQVYFEYNDLHWRSFRAFKKHITANNKSIELVKEETI